MAIVSVIDYILMVTILCHFDNVYSADIAVAVGSSVLVNGGDTAILDCSYTSTVPTPLLQWSKEIDGNRETVLRKTTAVVNEPDYTRHSVDGTSNLKITSTTDCDSGTYWCSLSGLPDNPGEDSVDLTVESPPCKPTIASSHDDVSEGETVYLTSVSNSVLEPFTYSWQKDDSPISDDLLHVFSEDNRNLTIYNVTKADEGYYVARVENSYGHSDSDPLFLNVTHYGPQYIDITNDKDTYNDGDQVELTCTADGNPLPSLTWSFSDDVIYETDDTVPGESRLTFQFTSSVTVTYTANNTYGVVTDQTTLKQSDDEVIKIAVTVSCIAFALIVIIVIIVLCVKYNPACSKCC